MTQRRYAIFGPGRVGRNIDAYLRHLGHVTTLLSRSDAAGEQARTAVAGADIVAAAIPDSALSGWATDWRGACAGKTVIHFSGALLVEGAFSFHPLYSFPKTLLDIDVLKSIAIARQAGAPPLSDVMPGAPNPAFEIADEDRAYYHALAVLSGNFAAFLWNQTAHRFQARFNVAPDAALAGYLAGLAERFRENPTDSLTGPVARRDRASVSANLKALEDDPEMRRLYEQFLAAAWPDYSADGA